MKTTKMLSTTLAATMALMIGVGAASAAPGGEGRMHDARGHGPMMMGQMLRDADSNSDGALTQEELDTYRNARVTEADASGDGAISLEEFRTLYLALNANRIVDAFQRLDEDGDGTVTQAELDARFGAVVERMDRNGDGQLDRDDRPRHNRGDRDHDAKRGE